MLFNWAHVVVENLAGLVDGQAVPCMGRCMAWWVCTGGVVFRRVTLKYLGMYIDKD